MKFIAATESDNHHHVFAVDPENPAVWLMVSSFRSRSDAVEYAGYKNGVAVAKSWNRLELTDEQRSAISQRLAAGENRHVLAEELDLSASQLSDLVKRWRRKNPALATCKKSLQVGPSPMPESSPLVQSVIPDQAPIVDMVAAKADAPKLPAMDLDHGNAAAILTVARKLPVFSAADIASETTMARGSITANLTKMVARGTLFRVSEGRYSLDKPYRAAELAAIEAHIAGKGVLTAPDFGDPVINGIWQQLKIRGHSLVGIPCGENGKRPFSLDRSPGLTRADLLSRAKVIIETEKPITNSGKEFKL